jgi:hypothetical protein
MRTNMLRQDQMDRISASIVWDYIIGQFTDTQKKTKPE